MLYMPTTYVYSPKMFLCKGVLSKDFEFVVLCANVIAVTDLWLELKYTIQERKHYLINSNQI